MGSEFQQTYNLFVRQCCLITLIIYPVRRKSMALYMLQIKYTPEATRNIAEFGGNTTVDRAMRR